MDLNSNVVTIRKYFEKDGGRKVEMSEFKNLTPEDREELGNLARIELSKQSK